MSHATPLALASFFLALGCSSSSGRASLTPLTAIVLSADTLAAGRGCGPEPGKILKYAAVVHAGEDQGSGEPGRGLARGAYDCFVDAIFTNLPTRADGTAPYTLDVVAFDATEYESQKDAIDALNDEAATLDLAAFAALTGSARFSCEATLRLDVSTTATCAPRALVPVTPTL